MKKIFYSWQSDLRPIHNKIKSALEIAAEQLGGQLDEPDRPEVDSDTQGVPGSENILPTIFAKIEKCAVFVADVTPIATAGIKLLPNPNVMTEVGYAIRAKGPNTRLYLYCTDKPIDVSRMPFDIRDKSLFWFPTSISPSDMAERLAPQLSGMLKAARSGSVKFELIDGDSEGWANWSGKHGIQSAFRYHIHVDNFEGKIDYIDSAKIVSKQANGTAWQTRQFAFDDLQPNERLKIAADEILDVWIQLTDEPAQTQRHLPDIDRDIVQLVLTLRSDGSQTAIHIPPGRLIDR